MNDTEDKEIAKENIIIFSIIATCMIFFIIQIKLFFTSNLNFEMFTICMFGLIFWIIILIFAFITYIKCCLTNIQTIII